MASLRQRLGRSGRRKGESAILRAFCTEDALTPHSDLSDQLRESLVQTAAQIRLLVQRWFEPPAAGGLHLSTFIQQLLSTVVQYGGVSAAQLWTLLCETGPFRSVDKIQFQLLLRELGRREVLMQERSGLLLPGPAGERITGHYSFYAAFATEEEFRLVTAGKALGSLPLAHPVEEKSFLIFAGRRWQVIAVDLEAKVIEVVPHRGGRPPKFEGGGGLVHDRVREEMRRVLEEETPVPFLDAQAAELLTEARHNYRLLGLDREWLKAAGAGTLIFLWCGDLTAATLALALGQSGVKAASSGLYVEVREVSPAGVREQLSALAEREPPAVSQLARSVLNKREQKWDWLLPEALLDANYASHHLDVERLWALLRGRFTGVAEAGGRFERTE